MQRSTGRILTTHTGSLPRPAALVQMVEGHDQREVRTHPGFTSQVHAAVTEVVRKQAAIPALSHRSYTTYAGGLSRSLFRLPEVVFDTPCKARSEARRNPLQRWVAIWIELRHA